jgi:hypothetical protein
VAWCGWQCRWRSVNGCGCDRHGGDGGGGGCGECMCGDDRGTSTHINTRATSSLLRAGIVAVNIHSNGVGASDANSTPRQRYTAVVLPGWSCQGGPARVAAHMSSHSATATDLFRFGCRLCSFKVGPQVIHQCHNWRCACGLCGSKKGRETNRGWSVATLPPATHAQRQHCTTAVLRWDMLLCTIERQMDAARSRV